jgi:hypothetical protein
MKKLVGVVRAHARRHREAPSMDCVRVNPLNWVGG